MTQTTKKATVAILRIATRPTYQEVEDRARDLLAMLGGIQAIVPPTARRVLVKPSIGFVETARSGMSTHPELACAVAKLLRDAGLDAFIGEAGGCGTGRDTQRHFKVNGLAALTAEMGIPLVDFKQEDTVEVPVPEGRVVKKYHIAKAVMEADFRVSVPVLKTHSQATMTIALKNMKGCLPIDDEKMRMHHLDLNSHLVDLNTLIKPHLAVVDGIVGLMGYGPRQPGIPMNLGMLIGGTEAVAVDATCARICTFDPHEVEHVRIAEERGLGTTREEEIEVLGVPLAEAVYQNYVRPPRRVEELSPYPHIRIVFADGCTSCMTTMATVLHARVPKEKLRDGKPVTIVLGRNFEGPYGDNVLAMGKCTVALRGQDGVTWLPGCPPELRVFLKALKDRLGFGDEPEWPAPFADDWEAKLPSGE